MYIFLRTSSRSKKEEKKGVRNATKETKTSIV